MLYNGWERWISTTGADIKIGYGSKKTFQTVMGSWHEDFSQTLKMGEKQNDEETWGLEGGYSSGRGLSRHSLDFHSGKLGEYSTDESEGERKKKGKTTKNTRKRKSTIPAVDSPAMATRGKRGNK